MIRASVYELRAPEQNSIRELAERNIARAMGAELRLAYCTLPLDPAALVNVSNECDKIQFAVGSDGRPLLIGWPKGDGDCMIFPLSF